MSFSYKVKNELCRNQMTRLCCCTSEALGVLLYCNVFTSNEIRIITENLEFAYRLPKLFHKAFGISFDVEPDYSEGGKLCFQILIRDKIKKILDTLGFELDQFLSPHLNLALIEDDCCKSSFLRGVFLSGGSVTDPEKHYHLELSTTRLHVSREVTSLLLDMHFECKEIKRGSYYVLYLKQSESIEDFLTKIGAPVCAVDIMTAKVDKEIRNDANRAMNCDIANVNKILDASQIQIDAIQTLKQKKLYDKLPESFQETCELRILNPELSLTQLASLHTPSITKSCINHRFRKILELSKK